MKRRRDHGFTAVELIVVIVVVGIAAAVTLPALLRGARNARVAECAARLRTLWKAQADVVAKTGRPPADLGGAYWLALSQGPSPAIAPGSETFFCPLSGDSPRPGATSWRGPGRDPATLPLQEPLGADRPGDHGAGEGGHVLMKNGEVHPVRERDGLWQAVAERLAP